VIARDVICAAASAEYYGKIICSHKGVAREWRMHQEQAEGHDRREAFIAALQDGRSVTGAAMAAGIKRALLYKWRGEMPDFAAAWDDAVETATDLIEEEALHRARHGVQKPVFYRGQQIGVVTVHDNRLLMFLLQRRRPSPPPARAKTKTKTKTKAKTPYVSEELAAQFKAAKERMARHYAEQAARKTEEAAETGTPMPAEGEPDDAAEASPFVAPLREDAPAAVHAASDAADSAPVAPRRRPPWPSDLPDAWRDIPLSQLTRMTWLTSAQVLAVQSYGTPDPDAPTFPPPWDGSDRHLRWPVPRLSDRQS
jgi:hypothetical protein